MKTVILAVALGEAMLDKFKWFPELPIEIKWEIIKLLKGNALENIAVTSKEMHDLVQYRFLGELAAFHIKDCVVEMNSPFFKKVEEALKEKPALALEFSDTHKFTMSADKRQKFISNNLKNLVEIFELKQFPFNSVLACDLKSLCVNTDILCAITSQFKYLRKLRFEWGRLSGGDITTVLAPHPYLRNLTFQFCSYLEDKHFQAIGAACPDLRSFTLFTSPMTKGRTYHQFGDFVKQCPHLTRLTISCQHFDDTALEVTARHRPNLMHITLNNCPRITNVGLLAIAVHCHQLRTLELGRCTQITNEGMLYISRMCKSLTHLNLLGCPNISSLGIREIVKECKKLESLNVSYSNIGDAELKSIAQHCRALRSLTVSDVADKKEGIAYLMEALPNLEIKAAQGTDIRAIEQIRKELETARILCVAQGPSYRGGALFTRSDIAHGVKHSFSATYQKVAHRQRACLDLPESHTERLVVTNRKSDEALACLHIP